MAAAVIASQQRWNQFLQPDRDRAPAEAVADAVGQVGHNYVVRPVGNALGRVHQAAYEAPAAQRQQWNQFLEADRDRAPGEFVTEWMQQQAVVGYAKAAEHAAVGYQKTAEYAPVVQNWVQQQAVAGYDTAKVTAPVAGAWIQQRAAVGVDVTTQYARAVVEAVDQARAAPSGQWTPMSSMVVAAPLQQQKGWNAWLPGFGDGAANPFTCMPAAVSSTAGGMPMASVIMPSPYATPHGMPPASVRMPAIASLRPHTNSILSGASGMPATRIPATRVESYLYVPSPMPSGVTATPMAKPMEESERARVASQATPLIKNVAEDEKKKGRKTNRPRCLCC